MGADKRYDGYAAYDYLDPGADYTAFELADRFAGFDPYPVELNEEAAARHDRLVSDHPVISLHDHPFYFPADLEADLFNYIREGRAQTAYADLAETPLDAVFDMHFDGLSGIHSQHGWKWDDVVHDLSMRAADIAHSDYAFRGRDVDDLRRAHETGRLAIVPALESAAMIENELDRLDQLYGLGVRSMGVTYNASNSLGTGKGDIYERDGGLTGFGARAIERMNTLGIAISTSHASERTALDVCDVSDAPVLNTHAIGQHGAMAERGTADAELEAVADTGGLIGVAASTVLPDLETFMSQFEYLVDLVGIDHVCFGPDVLYGDHTALLRELAAFHGVDLSGAAMDEPYVRGLENPTEAWQNIPRWLVREGYSDEEIAQVLGGNVLRVLEEIW
ncbi:MAG: dipeptidase [Halobacteriales archaeon]